MYLEALDRQVSIKEEKRLWKILRQEPPEHSIIDSAATTFAPAPANVGEPSDWRGRLQLEAVWERNAHQVAPGDFANMEQHGVRARKRRALLRGKLLVRDITGNSTSDVSG